MDLPELPNNPYPDWDCDSGEVMTAALTDLRIDMPITPLQGMSGDDDPWAGLLPLNALPSTVVSFGTRAAMDDRPVPPLEVYADDVDAPGGSQPRATVSAIIPAPKRDIEIAEEGPPSRRTSYLRVGGQ